MKYHNVLALALMTVSNFVMAESCVINATSLQLGSYDPITRQSVDSYSEIHLNCDQGVMFRIRLDPGAHAASSFQPRKLRALNGVGTLAYNLYTDSSRTRVWGDSTGNTDIKVGIGTGNSQTLIIYSRLLARQNVPAGTYTDTVVINVDW